VDFVGAVGDLAEGGVRLPSPSISDTTGVAHELGSCKLDSTSTGWLARLSRALEERKRAAHNRDTDTKNSSIQL
jgi:hypothetical protein